MAALISSDFEIPAEISQGIFEKAQKGSTLAQLSGARPQKFGKTAGVGTYIATESRTRRRGRAEIANPNCICS